MRRCPNKARAEKLEKVKIEMQEASLEKYEGKTTEVFGEESKIRISPNKSKAEKLEKVRMNVKENSFE